MLPIYSTRAAAPLEGEVRTRLFALALRLFGDSARLMVYGLEHDRH
jgi:hypothetical protein